MLVVCSSYYCGTLPSYVLVPGIDSLKIKLPFGTSYTMVQCMLNVRTHDVSVGLVEEVRMVGVT